MQKILIRRLMSKILILAVTATGMPFSVQAQQVRQDMVTLPTAVLGAQEVFDEIESQTDYKFTVNRSNFDGSLKVNITEPRMTVTAVLDKLFEGTPMTYAIDGKYILVPVRRVTASANVISLPSAKTPAAGGVRGIITNSVTREAIADAHVQLTATGHQAVSDYAGRFSLNDVRPGSYAVRISIPQFDTIIYRDALVNSAALTQLDINVPLSRKTWYVAPEQVELPATGINRKKKRAQGADPRHTFVLVEVQDELALPRPRTALKTNLLYLAAITPNLGVELRLAPRWTLDVSAGMNPGKFDRNVGSFRHWFIQPEARYWFSGAFERHFVGLNALAWQFDVCDVKIPFIKNFMGKRYEGYAMGAGLTYGYHLPVAARWSLEFTIGAGYLYKDYRDYEDSESETYTRNSDKHYFGPTKAGLSLAFILK